MTSSIGTSGSLEGTRNTEGVWSSLGEGSTFVIRKCQGACKSAEGSQWAETYPQDVLC